MKKDFVKKNSKFDEKFIQVSRDIHFLNDRRAVIKLNINKILGSNIREIKTIHKVLKILFWIIQSFFQKFYKVMYYESHQ